MFVFLSVFFFFLLVELKYTMIEVAVVVVVVVVEYMVRIYTSPPAAVKVSRHTTSFLTNSARTGSA